MDLVELVSDRKLPSCSSMFSRNVVVSDNFLLFGIDLPNLLGSQLPIGIHAVKYLLVRVDTRVGIRITSWNVTWVSHIRLPKLLLRSANLARVAHRSIVQMLLRRRLLHLSARLRHCRGRSGRRTSSLSAGFASTMGVLSRHDVDEKIKHVAFPERSRNVGPL